MDAKLEHYLKTVEGYLKNMPISERIDVIKELKNSIEKLQIKEALSMDEILQRLGSPKNLAAGYLGDKISIGSTLNINRIMMVISFYSLTSLKGLFVVPCGTVLAGGLMFSGIITPIAGLIKFIGYLVGYDVPFVVIQLGGFQLHPIPLLLVTIILGVLLFLLGKRIWKSVIKYIKNVSAAKRKFDERV